MSAFSNFFLFSTLVASFAFSYPAQAETTAKNPIINLEKRHDIRVAMLLEAIDSGNTRYKDATHLWAFKEFPDRHDNLLSAVLVLEEQVLFKKIMHHFLVL